MSVNNFQNQALRYKEIAMRKRSCIIAFAVTVLTICCMVAVADVPDYQPYGAWRGRIRYVEGPFRTKTRIHWGNGVTQVGGQVLMHGLTVAGDVFTNPNTLGALVGRSEDEQRSINDEWQRIRDQDAKLRRQLEGLRTAVGLSAQLDSSAPSITPDPFPAGTVSANSEALFTELKKLRVLADAVKESAKAYFDKVNNEDPTRLKFVAAVLGTSAAPTGASSHAQLTTEWSDFQLKFQALQDGLQAAQPLVDEWKSRIAEDDRQRPANGRSRFPTAVKHINEIDEIAAAAAQWNEHRVE
jgi:hypothetical protein